MPISWEHHSSISARNTYISNLHRSHNIMKIIIIIDQTCIMIYSLQTHAHSINTVLPWCERILYVLFKTIIIPIFPCEIIVRTVADCLLISNYLFLNCIGHFKFVCLKLHRHHHMHKVFFRHGYWLFADMRKNSNTKITYLLYGMVSCFK